MEPNSPEYQALISVLLWATCVLQGRKTPGMTMMKLRYSFSRTCDSKADNIGQFSYSRRVQLGCIWVAAPCFFWRLWRFGSSLPHRSVYSMVRRTLERAGGIWRYACLFNVAGFLRDSSHRCYPYASQRLVGVGLSSSAAGSASRNTVFQSPTSNRALPNFQFINRQLLWEHATTFSIHASSFLTCLSSYLPTASVYRTSNPHEMRRIQVLSSWWRHYITGMAQNTSIATSRKDLPATTLDDRACGKCSILPANNPYLASSGHTYCYYCIKNACMKKSLVVDTTETIISYEDSLPALPQDSSWIEA